MLRVKRSLRRMLTTHTGSLPRPDDLADLLFADEEGQELDPEPFKARIGQAVRAAVARQAALGLDVVSDGEMSKVSFKSYVTRRLAGFEGGVKIERAEQRGSDDFPNFTRRQREADARRSRVKRFACTGPVRYADQERLRWDLEHLRAALRAAPAEEAFVTAASPGVVVRFQPNRFYASEEEYLWAVADAMAVEYRAIYEAGFLLQLDCPDLTHQEGLTPEEHRRHMARSVEALNSAVAGIPPEAMRLHVCWGNYEGPHHLDVPLGRIIDALLRARPAGLSFEGANPRHGHEWKVFEEVALPDGKVLLPGVIDSTTNYIEHPELVAQRIVQYARVAGRENVIASVDCGFGTFAGPARVDPDIAYAKLGSLVEGARLASAELWP
jgi:5-methyltetrahydropteroyltriglutamate--homocysteine methyltransferase